MSFTHLFLINPRIEYKRIKISCRNNDGTIGDLILPTSRLYSFGVSEGSGDIPGFSIPLCLFSRDGPTKEEREWVDLFDKIVENCIDYLLVNRDEIERYELERRDLDRLKGGLSPLYWKIERVTGDDGRVCTKSPWSWSNIIRKVEERRVLV